MRGHAIIVLSTQQFALKGVEFVFEYPLWYLWLSLVAGFGLAWFFYLYKAAKSPISATLRKLLWGVRGFLLSLGIYLLFAPLLRYISRNVEKPIIVFMVDQSESMLAHEDSAALNQSLTKPMLQALASLGDRFETALLGFGDQLSVIEKPVFNQKHTDIADALAQLNGRFYNRNVGAIVLASDGLYNRGINPIYQTLDLKAPIYTVAYGDTLQKKDLILSKVNHNQYAYIQSKFAVEVLIKADKLQGKSSKLSIFHEGQKLFEKPFNIDLNSFFRSETILLEALKPGLQRFTLILDEVNGEYTIANNRMDIYVEVIDSRQKVLILSEGVHPDIGALKMALQTNRMIDVESALIKSFSGKLRNYSLVILHQLPSSSEPARQILSECEQLNLPIWMIVGARTQLYTLNQLNLGVNINPRGNDMNAATAELAEGFSLFNISDEVKQALTEWPPLDVPYGEIKAQNSLQVFLKQRIGRVSTQYPLMLFRTESDNKAAILMGEGIWRWRMMDFARKQSHDRFNEWVNRIVQYLSLKKNDKRFVVQTARQYFENEPVIFDAELFNESFESVNHVEAKLYIYNAEGKAYPFVFSPANVGYRLKAGVFPSGDYTYSAKTQLNGKTFEEKGAFTIKAIQVELVNTRADHALLNELALQHGGRIFYPTEWEKIVAEIKQREDIKPISFADKKLVEWIELPWLLMLLIVSLTLEWVLRRYAGHY